MKRRSWISNVNVTSLRETLHYRCYQDAATLLVKLYYNKGKAMLYIITNVTDGVFDRDMVCNV